MPIGIAFETCPNDGFTRDRVPSLPGSPERDNNELNVSCHNKRPPQLLYSSSKKVRTIFLRKVFGVLFLQMTLALVIVICCLFVPSFQLCFTNENLSGWKFWSVSIISFVLGLFIITALKNWMRKRPMDIVLAVFIGFGVGIFLGVLAARLRSEKILIGVGIAGTISFFVVLFTFQRKLFFTPKISIGYVWTLLLITFGFLCIKFSVTDALIIMASPGLFSTYIVVGTQLEVKHQRKELTSEEYVFGAIAISVSLISAMSTLLRVVLSFLPCCKCLKPKPKQIQPHATSIVVYPCVNITF